MKKTELSPSSEMKFFYYYRIWYAVNAVSRAKQFWMKDCYLQCKQFQFINSMLLIILVKLDKHLFGHSRNIFRAKMAQPFSPTGLYAYG